MRVEDQADGEQLSDSDVAPPPAKGKALRSASGVKLSVTKTVLEKVCVICEKTTRYLSVKGKTKQDKLVKAQTQNAGNDKIKP